MSALASLLRVLDRSDVSEVRLQTDSVAAAAQNGKFAPLTKAALSTPQIEQLVQGTSVANVLAQGVQGKVDLSLGEAQYTVLVQRAEQRLQLRFFRASDGAGISAPATGATSAQAHAAPAAAPEPVVAQTSGASAAAVPSATAAVRAGPRTVDQKARAELCAILSKARQQQASDVHIFAGQAVRVRRSAELTSEGDAIPVAKVEAMLRSVLSEQHDKDLERQGYADLSLDLPNVGRLRVNIGKQASGFKGCFRLVVNDVPTLDALGLPKELENVSHYHQGLAVISGPNGQGKTTTMAAIVDLINAKSPHHIITVEDPVEILHPVKRALMSQREVGAHTRSFARALKAALREDPDVIVVGELRDRETVEIALSAAETGHLVIATMSTRSAAKTIDRLIDLFPPDEQSQVRATLAGALKIIVSQRLVPGVNGKLVAVAELITGNVPLWNLIRENKLFQLPSLQQRGRGLGMIKFDTSLLELVQAGKISEEVAKKNAENAVELEKALKPQPAAPATPEKKGPGSLFGKKES